MEYGIALSAGGDAWCWARRAEALGFSHAWFRDTQMLCVGGVRSTALMKNSG